MRRSFLFKINRDEMEVALQAKQIVPTFARHPVSSDLVSTYTL